MSSVPLLVASVSSFVLGLAPVEPATTCCTATAAISDADDAAPAFERIKKLQGKWVLIGEDGSPTDEVISHVRVTAGGSAVLETLFPGTKKEMITLYHMDGDDLTLTHYCVLGNQPHMKATTITDDRIVFVCDGRGVASKNDAHMHQGTITWVGKNRLRTEWLQHVDSEVAHTAAFELVRESH